MLYVALTARSTAFALDFVVGTGIGCGIGIILRRAGLADICVLGVAVANGAVRNIWVVPTELSPFIYLSAVL
jgi:hypothetical protein